jgi:hypothetical protein
MKQLSLTPTFAFSGFVISLISLLLQLHLSGLLIAFILGVVVGAAGLFVALRPRL